MNPQTCKTCTHYRQHYLYDGERCHTVNCGHCVYPRLKARAPGTKACAHYEPREQPPVPEIVDFFKPHLLRWALENPLPPETEE